MKDDVVLMGIVLSDSAIREVGTGKVSFIGSFHQYQSAGFPLAVPAFFITPILTNIRGKIEKSMTVAVRIEDPRTGQVLATTLGNVAAPPEYAFTGSEVIDVPFPMSGLFFQTAGNYSIIVLIDGEKIGERVLPVRSITVSQPPPQT